MAEPSLEYIRRISLLFCERYNLANGTKFNFDKIEDKPCEVDFYIKDGEYRLPIQYSIIQTTPFFLRSSAQTGKVTRRIEQMAKVYGFKCTASIVFHTIPIKEEQIERLVRCFILFLQFHLMENSFKWRFSINNDLKPLTGIFEYLSEFEIVSVGSSQFGLIIGNEAWGFERTIDQDVEYHFSQIREKDARYTPGNNIILLLDMDPMPLTGISLDELRKKCNTFKFNCKEIWQVNIGNSGYCDKIYPFDENLSL